MYIYYNNNMMLALPESEREALDDFIFLFLIIRLIVFILRFQPVAK